MKRVCFIVLAFVSLALFFKASAANGDMEKRVEELTRVPENSLMDSIRSFYYDLYHFEADYKIEILERLCEICKDRNDSAYLKSMGMLANVVNDGKHRIVDEALLYAKEKKHDQFLFDYSLLKSNFYRQEKKLDSALICLFQARELVKKESLDAYVLVQHQIGDVYYAANLFREAKKQFQLVDSLKGDINEYNFWRKTVIRNNIGLIDLHLGNNQEALSAFNTSEKLKMSGDISHGDSVCIAYYRSVKSSIFFKMNQLDSALVNGAFAYDFFRKTNDLEHLIGASIAYIDALIDTGNQKKVEEVMACIDEKYAGLSLSLEDEIAIAKIKIKYAHLLNDSEDLFAYYNIHSELRDSLNNQFKAVNVVRMFAENEYANLAKSYKYEKRIENLLIAFILVLVAFILLVLIRAFQFRKLNVSLNNSNRTKDKLFSIISHDLRSPFNALLGLSEVLKEHAAGKDYELVQSCASGIHEKAEELFYSMEQLLTWSLGNKKAIEYKYEQALLIDLINRAISLNKLKAEGKNVEFVVEEESAISVEVDRNSMITVISNVISNAIKFSYPLSSIRIKIINEKETVRIAISDTGVGMTSEQIDEILNNETHYTTRGTKNEKGTGLGLQICKEFVKKNRGEMRIESEPGNGTTFIVSLKKVLSN